MNHLNELHLSFSFPKKSNAQARNEASHGACGRVSHDETWQK